MLLGVGKFSSNLVVFLSTAFELTLGWAGLDWLYWLDWLAVLSCAARPFRTRYMAHVSSYFNDVRAAD